MQYQENAATNIRLGRLDADSAEVRMAAQEAGAAEIRTRALCQRASTAEVDPRAKPRVRAALNDRLLIG